MIRAAFEDFGLLPTGVALVCRARGCAAGVPFIIIILAYMGLNPNQIVCVVFQGASDGNAKTRRNIAQKLKKNEKLDFHKKIEKM